jgi:hypothetical protein
MLTPEKGRTKVKAPLEGIDAKKKKRAKMEAP